MHDLRNQLTILVGYADNISHVMQTREADQEIADLRRCAERCLALSQDLLAAGRPRTAVRQPVDLNHVLDSVVEALLPVTGERVLLRVRPSSVPVPIMAEPSDLERVLLNLALNACDAIVEDGVLTIETAVVHGRLSGEMGRVTPGPYARLTVTDTGTGMTPEIKARIFDPFFTTKERGTGLGLSSVAYTVRQLRGTIFVESQPGRGTSVNVILPLAADSDSPR